LGNLRDIMVNVFTDAFVLEGLCEGD